MQQWDVAARLHREPRGELLLNHGPFDYVSLYTRWVPVLERLLAGVEGDLEEFYRLMERLRGRSSEERRAILRWFEAQTAQASD